MNNVIRFDPFRDFYSMSRTLDRLMERSLGERSAEWQEPMATSLPLNVIEKENEFQVKAHIAGFDPDKLEITYNDKTLTITGEVKQETQESDAEGKYHVHELREGTFYRSIIMPSDIDAEKIEAETENGILTLHLPKREEVKPKKIEIKPKTTKVIDEKTEQDQ